MLVVGGAVFGIATVVQAAIPSSDGVIHGCYGKPGSTILAGTPIGPLPTITHPATGQYGFSISGLGTGCVLPQLTGQASNIFLTYAGGSCGGGGVTTTVFTSSGADGNWDTW